MFPDISKYTTSWLVQRVGPRVVYPGPRNELNVHLLFMQAPERLLKLEKLGDTAAIGAMLSEHWSLHRGAGFSSSSSCSERLVRRIETHSARGVSLR